jgi:hypothetical protein
MVRETAVALDNLSEEAKTVMMEAHRELRK